MNNIYNIQYTIKIHNIQYNMQKNDYIFNIHPIYEHGKMRKYDEFMKYIIIWKFRLNESDPSFIKLMNVEIILNSSTSFWKIKI